MELFTQNSINLRVYSGVCVRVWIFVRNFPDRCDDFSPKINAVCLKTYICLLKLTATINKISDFYYSNWLRLRGKLE